MRTLAVGVLLVLVGSPLAGVVVLFLRIDRAALTTGFVTLAVAAGSALVIAAGCKGAAWIIEAWQPKADINTTIDNRVQIAMDRRQQQATLQAPPESGEYMTDFQRVLFAEKAR